MVPITELDHSVPLFHVSTTSPRGSLCDPPEREGATRLLLRLMRRSVNGMSAEAVEEALDDLGATLSVDVRRSTAGFSGSAIARSASDFLDLYHRIVTEPAFDQGEFERVRKEAIADWVESLDNDSLLGRRAFTRMFYAGHPYARLTTGTPASLERVTLGDMKALHEGIFRSAAPLVTVAGDLTRDRATGFQARLAEGVQASSAGQDESPGEARGPKGRHLTFVDKPERTQTQILVGCMGTHPKDDDHFALYLGHTIFGGTFGARLSREVRGKRGWSYGAYSDLSYDRERQPFSLSTFPQASDAAACLALELEMLEDFVTRGVTRSELRAAKKYLSNSHVFTVDTASKRATAALDRQVYGLPDDYHSAFVERIFALNLEDVNAAIRRRLSFDDLEITVVGTYAAIGEQLKGAVRDLDKCDVVPFDARD